MAAALEGRSRLLVFDNCEHVLDAAADLIETILARSTTVNVSGHQPRRACGSADEQLWPVPSLDVIAGADSAAAALFVERAQRWRPDVLMSAPDESAAVVEICRRLDGIPLAIELAASRMVSMTATEVRDRLDDRFRLLVGSRRGLERHQTLRHAVQWSYDLLDDAEKALLTTCSVFAGGFDLAGACAVAGSADDLATLDLLDALVRKSLLVADRSSGRTRFTMLETIRQFAEEQLVASGGGDIARTAHARYFAGREADVMALWDSPRQREAYEWFTVELANLRTAFRWAADHDDLDTAAAIAIYATFLGFMGRAVRTQRVGRGAHRACTGRPTSPAGAALRDGHACARHGLGGWTWPSAISMPSWRLRKADASTRFRSKLTPISAVHTYRQAIRNDGWSCVATSSHARRALIPSPVRAWLLR